jgi:hypothetical protein
MAGEHVRALREYAEHQAGAGERFALAVGDWIRAADVGLARVEGQQEVLAPLVALAHERLAGEAEALDLFLDRHRELFAEMLRFQRELLGEVSRRRVAF